MADAPNPDGLIASRLEHLFRTVHPADRGPYTPGDVAAAINAEAGEDVISGQSSGCCVPAAGTTPPTST